MGCCVRPCCVGAAVCDRDAARVRGCSVRATVVRAVCWCDRECHNEIQTCHNEIQKSILVKVRLAQKYGISKLIFSLVCFDTHNSLENTSKTITKVYQKVFIFLFFYCITSLSFLIDPCIKR
jgi:hypothetical protein